MLYLKIYYFFLKKMTTSLKSTNFKPIAVHTVGHQCLQSLTV